MLASLALPSTESLLAARPIMAYIGLSVSGGALVVAVCFLRGESIARRLWPEERIDATGLTRRELLLVGIALLGVSLALSALPAITQFAARALWYAEGSRQSMFWEAMQPSWEPLIENVLALVLGIGAALYASTLADALDDRADGSQS